MSTLLANIKRTTHAQLDAYKAWNVDAIVAPRADDCTYRYLPESMNQPTMDNDQFREYFSTIIPLLEGFDVRKTQPPPSAPSTTCLFAFN